MNKNNTQKPNPQVKNTHPAKEPSDIFLFICFAAVIALFALGLVIPETFWTISYASFLPGPWGVVVIGGLFSIGMILFFVLKTDWKKWFEANNKFIFPVFGVLVTAILGFIYQSNIIQTSVYGDHANMLKDLEQKFTDPNQNYFGNIIGKGWLDFRGGLGFAQNMGAFVKHSFGVDFLRAFQILNAICGVLFLLVWIRFIHAYFTDNTRKIIAFLIVALSGSTLVFYGYIEVYAFALLFFSLALTQSILYINKPKVWKIPILLFLVLLAMRSHFAGLICLMPVILSILHVYRDKLPAMIRKLLTLKRALLFLVLPALLVFLYIYAGVLKNNEHLHNVPYKPGNYWYNIFLPTKPGPAPLNHYTLFSGGHLGDYFMNYLFWSSPVLLIVLVSFSALRKRIDFNQPAVFIMVLTFIAFGFLFFFLNPLLNPVRDWDLFCLPAPAFLLLGLVLLKEWKGNPGVYKLMMSIGILSLIGIPVFIVSTNKQMLSYRLEAASKRVFKTYYAFSNYTLKAGYKNESDSTELFKREQQTIKDLKPFANKGRDPEYQLMLVNAGNLAFTMKNFDQAINWSNAALGYGQPNLSIIKILATSYFNTKKYNECIYWGEVYLGAEFDEGIAKIAISSALTTNNKNKALQLINNYLGVNPNDAEMLQLRNNLMLQK